MCVLVARELNSITDFWGVNCDKVCEGRRDGEMKKARKSNNNVGFDHQESSHEKMSFIIKS